MDPDNSNLKLDYSNMKPKDSDMNGDNSNILPDKSHIYCDNSNTKLDYSDMKTEDSNMKPDYSNTHSDKTNTKPGKIKAISKKKTKMKYRKYFSITIMNEEEMLKIEEKRKMDLFGDAEFKCDTCIIVFRSKDEFVKHTEELHSQVCIG